MYALQLVIVYMFYSKFMLPKAKQLLFSTCFNLSSVCETFFLRFLITFYILGYHTDLRVTYCSRAEPDFVNGDGDIRANGL